MGSSPVRPDPCLPVTQFPDDNDASTPQSIDVSSNISISFTNGTVKIDRRSYLLDNG
jgi:hypothetical protein